MHNFSLLPFKIPKAQQTLTYMANLPFRMQERIYFVATLWPFLSHEHEELPHYCCCLFLRLKLKPLYKQSCYLYNPQHTEHISALVRAQAPLQSTLSVGDPIPLSHEVCNPTKPHIKGPEIKNICLCVHSRETASTFHGVERDTLI